MRSLILLTFNFFPGLIQRRIKLKFRQYKQKQVQKIVVQPSYNLNPVFYWKEFAFYENYCSSCYSIEYLFLFRKVLKSKVVLKACSLSTCLKMLICQCPNTILNFFLALSEESMLRIDARYCVRLPPKVTQKLTLQFGPLWSEKKKV